MYKFIFHINNVRIIFKYIKCENNILKFHNIHIFSNHLKKILILKLKLQWLMIKLIGINGNLMTLLLLSNKTNK